MDKDVFDLTLAEQDEFGQDDDDLDLDQLVQVTETVEQQRGQITFVSFGEHDPDPPAPLPSSTPSFHPFDPENLRTWIYPTNYPIRGYQFNIVQKALFNNTLVALPTGLGKTFIAAVVMFNYYRWFPHSTIIFMAPTRPLVEQQIEACFTICGLPQEDTIDMMGNTTPAKRKELWKSKRVFFATPQTVQKDLETGICPAEKIVCLVVDEAHKATGNFAYSAVVRRMSKRNKHVRVLALTATPGSTLDAVQAVVENLHITQIQIRTEDSMDIREFSHGKNIQHMVVKLSYTEGSTGILPRVIDDFKNKVFGPLLVELSKRPTTVKPDVDKNSSFGLRSARLNFQLTAKNVNNALKFQVVSLFLVAEHAARAYELLCQHGVVPFVESIDSILEEFKKTRDTGKKLNKSQKAFLDNNILQAILRRAKQEMIKPDFIGHPKMDKLVSILLQHFTSLPEGESSKVMIFSSYRTSVQDICNVLNRHAPLLRPSFFVGQASDKNGVKGLKQSEQQQVIQKFKLDVFNILVSTSIGEEGLDIGEVDLIVCFDSQSSPIRMLQRMGRTGRKRKGKCILLMTESEEKKFQQAKDAYSKIQDLIARGGLIKYYPTNPTILPNNYKPTLCRKKLEVGQFKRKVVEKKRKRIHQEEDAFHTPEGYLRPEVKEAFVRSFSDHRFQSMKEVFDHLWPVERTIKSINRSLPIQAVQRPTYRVGHSVRTIQFAQCIQRMEHRILNPDEPIRAPQVTTKRPQQTRLYLPSKPKLQQSTLFQHLVQGSSSKRSRRVDDDDMADFMASHDMAQLIDTDAIFSSTEQDMPPLRRDKGKSKAQENEPFLQEEKEEEEEEQEGMQVSLPDLPKLISDHTLSSITPPPDDDDNDSLCLDESDDAFDDLDEDLLALMMTHKKEIGFDDPLLPEFPFEMDNTVSTSPLQFSWTGKIPKLSAKAKALLEKRESVIKARLGRFVSFRLSIDEPESMETDSPVIVLDSQPEPSKSPLPDPIKDKPPSDNDDDDDDEFGFIDDGMFVNMFENKLSEDDGFTPFMFTQPTRPSQTESTQQMAQKSSLYAEQQQQQQSAQDNDEVFVFDFNQPFSDSSHSDEDPKPTIPPTSIVLTSDDDEDHALKTGSPYRLANKTYTPSPLRHDLQSSENEASPLIVQRKRRPHRVVDLDDSQSPVETGKRKRRLRQRSSVLSPVDEDDDMILPPTSRDQLLKRLESHQKRRLTYDASNPFFDMEAEKSSDEGHTTEDEEGGGSLLDSFINDNSDLQGSVDRSSQSPSLYARLREETNPNRKHWMDRFDANKWLDVNQEEDSIVQTEDELEPESIQDFSSDFAHPTAEPVSGDDFM